MSQRLLKAFFFHEMHPVVSYNIILWDHLHSNYMNKQIDTNISPSVYLAKASLHVSTLTGSSSDESIEM
jgi:hypothetical protein